MKFSRSINIAIVISLAFNIYLWIGRGISTKHDTNGSPQVKSPRTEVHKNRVERSDRLGSKVDEKRQKAKIKIPSEIAAHLLSGPVLSEDGSITDALAFALDLNDEQKEKVNTLSQKYINSIAEHQIEGAGSVVDEQGVKWVSLPASKDFASEQKEHFLSDIIPVMGASKARACEDFLKTSPFFEGSADDALMRTLEVKGEEYTQINRIGQDGKVFNTIYSKGGWKDNPKYRGLTKQLGE